MVEVGPVARSTRTAPSCTQCWRCRASSAAILSLPCGPLQVVLKQKCVPRPNLLLVGDITVDIVEGKQAVVRATRITV